MPSRLVFSDKGILFMHEKNIELLRDEAQRLLRVQANLFSRMLAEPGVIAEARAGEKQTFDSASVPKHIEVLEGELAKLENLEMVLAVVGTMKAGKSTTINAIVGTEVLPNRNRPMTALPTLIRHTPGQLEPVLRFQNCGPVNNLISHLHEVIADKRSQRRLEGLKSNRDMAELLSQIRNNTHFEQVFEGADSIFGFLKNLNDLVRLATELGVDFPFTSYDEIHEIPVIEVEFAHLRETKGTYGQLTLLDTPGPNESGQQHLRKMLKEQLGKASAVLAVLDFTQLNSDADADIRRELKEIVKVTKGRLFTLVNRFDQKDRNADTVEQVREFISVQLMDGEIEAKHVFPVSAKQAYLANRAKQALHLHQALPTSTNQEWVADFAEQAFGASWEEEDLEDLAAVKRAADKLWKKSLFSVPLDDVIRAAHARAAAFAIDSAAAKLIDNAEQLSNFLGTRESALAQSSYVLQDQINSLMGDIERIQGAELRTRQEIDLTLASVTAGTTQVFEQVKSEALKTLEKYFKEGKRIERDQIESQQVRSKGVAMPWTNMPTFMQSFFGGMKERSNKFEKKEQHHYGDPDFEKNSQLISFKGSDEAKSLLRRIEASVEGEMKHAEQAMRGAMEGLLESFRDNFANDVEKSAHQIILTLNSRLADSGFSTQLKIPKMEALSLDFSAGEMLGDIIGEKTKTVTRHRRQSGVWGGVCSFFNTDDWGWESYNEQEQYFEIDIRKVRASVITGIETTFEGLGHSVSSYIELPLKKDAAAFFDDFKSKVEQIRGDILQSIRDQKHSKAEQDALAGRLGQLKKNIPVTLLDCRELQADVTPMLREDMEAAVC